MEIKQRDVETASELLHTRELLAEDPLHLIIPREGPWSELTFPELEGVPFVIDPAHLSMGRFTHQMCLRHGFSPNVVFETPDPFLQGHLVRTGREAHLGLAAFRAALAAATQHALARAPEPKV